MERQQFITIQEWMLDLGLKGSELLAYALVWGFSQDGETIYRGGCSYAAKWLGITKENARAVLNKLADKGLLDKQEQYKNGVKFCYYRIGSGTTPKIEVPPTPKTADSNDIYISKDISISNNKGNSTKRAKFDFYGALRGLGVSEKTASDWQVVRKQSKAVDTETSFLRIKAEIVKTGRSAEECIRLAVERNWRGFEAEWYFNARKTRQTAGKVDPVTAMAMRAGMYMGGVDYDEQ